MSVIDSVSALVPGRVPLWMLSRLFVVSAAMR
jgi:hypothetical protein